MRVEIVDDPRGVQRVRGKVFMPAESAKRYSHGALVLVGTAPVRARPWEIGDDPSVVCVVIVNEGGEFAFAHEIKSGKDAAPRDARSGWVLDPEGEYVLRPVRTQAA